MDEINDRSKAKQIRNLLLVIGSAVGVSFAAIFFMIYSYGPAGTYLAKNMILSPSAVKTLYFANQDANSHFAFELINFSYYDISQRTIKTVKLGIADYAKLYELIENDVSLLNGVMERSVVFNNIEATLSFKGQREGDFTPLDSRNLFEADFIKDYYRISLRGQNEETQWAYFKHAGILEQILELLHQNGNNKT